MQDRKSSIGTSGKVEGNEDKVRPDGSRRRKVEDEGTNVLREGLDETARGDARLDDRLGSDVLRSSRISGIFG